MRLSICIPTYNFGEFIGQTLDSILPQLTSGVEVIVLDGGSKDRTADEVCTRQATCPQLGYFHQEHRGGIDRDIEKAVDLANGEYCWLFSADDVMLAGAVEQVLRAIESRCDVYLCEHKMGELDLRTATDYPIFRKSIGATTFHLDDWRQRRAYFQLAKNSEVFFSFLAGQIFRKSVWDGAPVPESFRGTCWIVAGHLLWGVREGMTVSYMARCLLLKRNDNDSFADRGLVNRYRIAIEGFHHVAETIFGKKSEETRSIKRALRCDVKLRLLLIVKWRTILAPNLESRLVLDRIVRMHYADLGLSGTMARAVYMLTPASWVPRLVWLRDAVRWVFRPKTG